MVMNEFETPGIKSQIDCLKKMQRQFFYLKILCSLVFSMQFILYPMFLKFCKNIKKQVSKMAGYVMEHVFRYVNSSSDILQKNLMG